jgi:hypothetical protein
MAQTMTSMGTKVTANAAAVATAMTGTSTAEAQALGALLTVLGQRPDLAQPPQALVSDALKIQFTSPG